jgi:hypothetical protein
VSLWKRTEEKEEKKMIQKEMLIERLGELMKEAADGMGALDGSDTSRSRRCIEDFKEAAGEEVYKILKAVTEFYAGSVQVDWPSCPDFIVMDDEEGWASWIMADIVKKART